MKVKWALGTLLLPALALGFTDPATLDSSQLYHQTLRCLKGGDSTGSCLSAETFLQRYEGEAILSNLYPKMNYLGALSAFSIKRYERAESLFSAYLSNCPSNTTAEARLALFGLGLSRHNLGHYESAALPLAQSLSNAVPNRDLASRALFQNHLRQGDYAAALPLCESLEKAPSFAQEAKINAAWCLGELGRPEAALQRLRQTLLRPLPSELLPLRDYLSLRLGDLFCQSNRYEMALASYRLARQESYGEERLSRLTRVCYEAAQYPEAIIYCKKALSVSTNACTREGLLKLGAITCLKAGYLDLLEEILRDYPATIGKHLFSDSAEYRELMLFPGIGALRFSDFKRAYDRFQTFLKKYPACEESPKAALYAAMALGFQGLYKEAEKELQAWLTAYPDKEELRDEALYWQAMLPYYQGQDQEALEFLKEFYKTRPKSPHRPDVAYRLAALSYRKGDYEKAALALREVIKSFPASNVLPEARNTLGDALGALGDIVGAIEAYAPNLAATPSDSAPLSLEPALYALSQSVLCQETLKRPALVRRLLDPYLNPPPSQSQDKTAPLSPPPGFLSELLPAYIRACRLMQDNSNALLACRHLWIKSRKDPLNPDAENALALWQKLAEDKAAFKIERQSEAQRLLQKSQTNAAARLFCQLGDDKSLMTLPLEPLGPGPLSRRLQLAKTKEAEKVARLLVEKYPKNPLSAPGWLLLAEKAQDPKEMEALLEEGEQTFQTIAGLTKARHLKALLLTRQNRLAEALKLTLELQSQKGLSFEAKARLLLEAAALQESQKDLKSARLTYERLLLSYGAITNVAKEARARLEALKDKNSPGQ